MKLSKSYNRNGVKLLPDGNVRKKCHWNNDPKAPFFKKMERVITKQLKKPNLYVVPVYQFGKVYHNDNTVSYFYDMAKCQELSKIEIAIISSRVGFCRGPDVSTKNLSNHNDLIKFLDKAKKLGYLDLHYNNVMKYEGRYVLIDLEGFY